MSRFSALSARQHAGPGVSFDRRRRVRLRSAPAVTHNAAFGVEQRPCSLYAVESAHGVL
jgi:hypothetical protein